MDANLSQKGGVLYNSPYWKYVLSLQENPGEFQDKFTQSLVKAGTYTKLPDEIKQTFEFGTRSYAIAQENRLDPTKPEDLRKIAQKLGVLPK